MSRRSMTRDIHESIRLVLGKNVKILLKSPVKMELKGGDKTENRILVLTAHRLFVMSAKVPARIDHHFHYLDMKHLESKRSNHIAFTFATGHSDKAVTYSFRPLGESMAGLDCTIDELILALVSNIRKLFPGVPVQNVIGKIDIQPRDRSILDHQVWQDTSASLIGPCGGFSAQYSCMCDYYSLPFREEVAWDVDTIYFSHDSHEMNLQDFEHLELRDLLCIISALEHNTWFTKLKASGGSAKLTSEICERILQVVSKSISLEEIHVSSIGARWEFLAKLSQSMASNAKSALASFDLSCNFLEDKGLNHFSPVIGKHSKGLRHVNLSYCSLTGKGISHFASSLFAHRINSSTLTYLNLAGNSIKEDSQSLCTFLAQPNVIAILDISGTDTPLDVFFGALVRGCTTALTHLNLSRNPFSSKKAKEIPAAFKQYFASTLALQYLNMSHCKIPAEAVKHLLLGLACNEATANVELNLSSNALGANGANVLESCIGGVKCLTRLDLSDNNIEAEMAGVMQGIMRNKYLLSLNVSKNMTSVKAKHLANVMESIVQMIQDEDTSLQKLNLSDCKLKSEINNVINALGSNQCLQHIDITGNQMGDVGARLLAKALQINTRLRIVNLDRNNITLQGYTDLTYALQSNFAMRHIPFPTFDLQPFVKTHPERVDAIVHRMQELLQRNSSPHRFRNTAQAFRLTQGFLLSSTQQILDRVSAQTQDNIDALLKLNPDQVDSESVSLAKGMIEDAENSKHLLSALHEVTTKGTEVDLKLKQASLELSNFVSTHVHQNVESMLNCAEKQCPHVLRQNEGKTKSDMRTACQKKCQISPDFISTLIMDQLGLEIHNKINELNLVIANYISDKVIDDVIEGLGSQGKAMLNEAGSLKKKRSLTPEVLKGRSSSLSESLEQETTSQTSDATSQKSESSPLGTPQTNKRKSLQGRKLRPKSVADGGHDKEELDEISEVSNQNNTEDSLSLRNGAMDHDVVPELPSSTVLQHLGKARPKRTKKHAPSRGAVVVSRNSPKISSDDEGLSRFYSSSANSSFSPGSTPSGSPMLEDFPQRSSSVGSRQTKDVSIEDAKKSGKKEEKKIGLASPDVEKKSPSAMKTAGRLGAGLSCLGNTALDDDVKLESPEKRALSPSLHSLSDLFSKKDSSRQGSPKTDGKLHSPSVISPFATRKSESESTALKRRSLNAADETPKDDSSQQPQSLLSPDTEGKKTPDSVIKRHGLGHGGNPDLMAEIKEKRASMVPKALPDDFSPPSKPNNQTDDTSKSLFSQVKLRSTGLAGSLSSPTNEFPTKPDEAGDNKGSIVGLRTSKFSSSLMTTSTSPQTSSSLTSNNNSNPTSTGGTQDLTGPKPKPLPKPRPWSIVGVDRKSGEMTSVIKSEEPSSDSTSKAKAPVAQNASLTNTASSSRKSSVRDMINNMNKSSASSTEATPTEGFVRKKGGSLPRGVSAPTEESTTTNMSRSPNLSNSPKIAKRSDSTNDDPRILKLEDDFAYDDVLDV